MSPTDILDLLIKNFNKKDYTEIKKVLKQDVLLQEKEEYLEDVSYNCYLSQEFLKYTKDNSVLQKKIIKKIKLTPYKDFANNGNFLVNYASDSKVLDLLLKKGHEKTFIYKKYDMNGKSIKFEVFNILTYVKRDIDIWDYLLNNNLSDINDINNEGKTLLFGETNINKLSYLVNKGIDLNIRDKNGNTALFEADFETTKFLINNGININIKNNLGHNAILGNCCEKKAILLWENNLLLDGLVKNKNGEELLLKEFLRIKNIDLFLKIVALEEKKSLEKSNKSEGRNKIKRL